MPRLGTAALVAASIVLGLPAGATATGTFGPPEIVNTGHQMHGVAAGRLVGDPAVDVVAVSSNYGTFDLIEQTSPQKFALAASPAPGGNPQNVATADFDGDGDDDVAAAVNANLLILRNDAGTLVNAGSYAIGTAQLPTLAIADVDENGDPDVVVATGAAATVVARGGAGTSFTPASYATASGGLARSVALADFDADGIEDMAVGVRLDSDAGARLEIWKGSALGNFTLAHDYDAGAGRHENDSVGAGDIDGDGDPDVVIARQGPRTIDAFRGAAGTGFQPPVTIKTFGPTPTALAVGDFGRDGRADVAVALSDSTVHVLTSTGAFGRFTEAAYPVAANSNPTALKAADLDADGALDLIAASDTLGTVSILFNEVAANLGVSLTDAPDPVVAGESVTYTATVTNAGPDKATATAVTFQFSGGGSYASGSPGCSAAAATVTCTIGTLAAGAQVTRSITLAAPATPATLEVTASAAAAEHDPVAANDSAKQSTAVTGSASADLHLTQNDTPDPAAAGQPMTYHVTVANKGPTAAKNVVVTDQLPAGATYVNAVPSAGGACSKLAATVTCTFASVPKDGTVTVAVTVTPASAGTLTNQASATSDTPDPGPSPNGETESTTVQSGSSAFVPAASISNVSLTEGTNAGTTTATLNVTLNSPTEALVTIDYGTVANSATEGADYTFRSGTLTFAPGETSRQISVPIARDDIDEPEEVLYVDLSNPSGATLLDARGTITVADDDPPYTPPFVSVSGATVDEDGGDLTLTVTRGNPTTRTVTVRYTTTDGSARAGEDYGFASGTLTFDPGVTAQQVKLAIKDDDMVEPTETFHFDLAEGTDALIVAPRANIAITDDETDPTLKVADAAAHEDQALRFVATLSHASEKPVSAQVEVKAPGAMTGEYEPPPSTVAFPAGVTQREIVVPLIDDDLYETSEQLTLTLSAPQNATLTDAEAIGTIRDNEAPPTIVQAQEAVAEPAQAAMTPIKLGLSKKSALPVTFRVRTDEQRSGAREGFDYDPASTLITIPAGEDSASFDVRLLPDDLYEAEAAMTIALRFSEISGATYTEGMGSSWNPFGATSYPMRILITDDDPRPTPSVADLTISESDALAAVPIGLSGRSASSLGYTLTVIEETAKREGMSSSSAEGDFKMPESQRISLSGPSEFFEIRPKADTRAEGVETFRLELKEDDRVVAHARVSISDGPVAPSLAQTPAVTSAGYPTLTAKVGDVVACRTRFNGEPTGVAVRWSVNGSERASGERYAVQPGDANGVLRCHARATNAAGTSAEAASAEVRVGSYSVPAVGIDAARGVPVTGTTATPTLACNQAGGCVGTLTMSAPAVATAVARASQSKAPKLVKIGTARFRLRDGASKPVKVKLNARGRKLVKASQGGLPVRVVTKTKKGRRTRKATQDLILGG